MVRFKRRVKTQKLFPKLSCSFPGLAVTDNKIMDSSSKELLCSVRDGSLENIQSALVHNCDVNMTDDSGKTSLMIAAAGERWSSLPCLKLLIQNGADLNRVDTKGRSAMSSIDGDGPITLMFEKLKLLLEAGADPNKGLFYSFPTLMEIAFDQEKIDIIRLLLCQGADPNLWRFPALAFHCLIRDGHENLIRNMIINGALPENSLAIWASPGSKMFVSPLTTALYYDKIGLARYFMANLFMTKNDLCDCALQQRALAASMRGCGTSGLHLLNSMRSKPFPLRILSFVTVSERIGNKAGGHVGIKNTPEIPEDLKSTRRLSKLCVHGWRDIHLCLDHRTDLRAWPLGDFNIKKCSCADCQGDGFVIIKKCKCHST